MADLKTIYKTEYKDFFDSYLNGEKGVHSIIMKEFAPLMRNKDILDIGCGPGRLPFMMATIARKVRGTDYIEDARILANHMKQLTKIKNVEFDDHCIDGKKFGLITLIGVLEHIPHPHIFLKQIQKVLTISGRIIISVPGFMNIRGCIWQTLQILCNAKMSLTDRHFFSAEDMEIISKKAGLKIEKVIGTRFSQAFDAEMRVDMQRRLRKATGLHPLKIKRLLNIKQNEGGKIFDHLIKKRIIKKCEPFDKLPATGNPDYDEYLSDGSYYYTEHPLYKYCGGIVIYLCKPRRGRKGK